MAIGEQFAGLPMDQLIGSPLTAAADASIRLANSTADFINRVGFDSNGSVRNVAFKYEKRSMNEDGTSNLDEMKVDVPMLAIVPIPNLQVDEVNILFDMEVKQSERSESSLDLGASLTGSLNLGIIKVSVTGSVSAHQSNTRSSDNSAKYHVDVRATNHGIPEGLARVLDMMAANVAPSLVGSTLKDGNGQNLSEQARIKAERLKALRQEMSQIESRLGAAQSGLESSIRQLKKIGESQKGVYQGIIMRRLNAIENVDDRIKNAANEQERSAAQAQKAENDKLAEAYSQSMDEVNRSWDNFSNQAQDVIKMLADNGDASQGVSDMFALKSITEEGQVGEYGQTETYYNAISTAQKNAVEKQKTVTKTEEELFAKKSEYSDAMAGKTTTALPGNTAAASGGE